MGLTGEMGECSGDRAAEGPLEMGEGRRGQRLSRPGWRGFSSSETDVGAT